MGNLLSNDTLQLPTQVSALWEQGLKSSARIDVNFARPLDCVVDPICYGGLFSNNVTSKLRKKTPSL